MPRQSLTFTPNKNGNCKVPDYEWSVETTIGSTIDQSGKYIAGINSVIVNNTKDMVSVVDHANDAITAEATVTVLRCPISKLYGQISQETIILREFRDKVLMKTPQGQEIIRLYYKWSPLLAKHISTDKELVEQIKECVDDIMPWIRFHVE